LHDRGIPVLLCGMLAPRNLGADYGKAFDPIFTDLAGRYDALFYPFFLDGVFGNQALFQRDGLHPTASGVDEIVTRILPKAEELVAKAKTAAKTAPPS
jgi:acyl-CoA thioesterase-1